MKKLIGLMLFLISANIYAWNVFGPKDYDECILENMKGVNSDFGARLVNKSCREKFKEKSVDNNYKHKWTFVASREGVNVYEDQSTFTKQGKIVTIYLLQDYDKIQTDNNYKKQYYSRLAAPMEIDCINLTYRDLKSEYKSSHMGEGETILSYGLGQEDKINKESIPYKKYCMN
jgi:hypothetical protein